MPEPEWTPQAHYALWDSGQLLIALGDDMILLERSQVRRLSQFLARWQEG